MHNPWVFLLALAAAVVYVSAALTLKRAAELGAGLWHSTWVSNVLTALIFQFLLILPGNWQPLTFYWQPIIVALLFLAGQILTLWSFQKGDVSVTTPVLGLKIILVAIFITLILGNDLSWKLWLAALFSTLAIVLLNFRGGPSTSTSGTRVGATIISASLAACCYALFDVLVQKWAPAWGTGRFLPLMMGMVGLLSLPVAFLFPISLFRLQGPTKKWLFAGGLLFATQSILLVSSIAQFGEATTTNVIYSSRGLLSVLAVAWIGHWFHNAEKELAPAVLRRRFIGAAFMFTAILLVLI